MNTQQLYYLIYALGEAITNTECAIHMETRKAIREEFQEDIKLFEDAKKMIFEEINILKKSGKA